MKKIFNLLVLGILLIGIPGNQACNRNANLNDTIVAIDSNKLNIPDVKQGNFYEIDSSISNSVHLADTIIYNVIIKNPDPEDDWQEYSLKFLDKQALANIIFNAIYNGRLTPYNYQYENEMTIEEVKEMEKKHPRKEIANIQFTEAWYFNEKNLTFNKKVNSIMMAYERINKSGEVRYTAGIQVFFDEAKNLKQNK